MRSRPDAAAEALLALMIDDEPREDYGSSSRYDEDLGLEYSREAYPTAFWKSPFYVFLQIDPERALTALIQLIDFCTERWRADWERHASSPAPAVVLTLADGSARAFYGGWKVFDWAEASSPANGHIHCALSALERWLVDTLEAGGDCTSVVERLLRETTSASVLGVLVSIAKLRPRLLTGVLMPLLSTADLFELDGNRVEGGTRGAYLTTWSHEGELVFEAAKQWTFAPHRRRQFADVVGLALVESPGAAAVAAATAAALPPQDHPAAKLRRDALCARLDPTNYPATPDPETGELTYAFDPPDALVEAYAAQQVASGPKLQSVLLASALESVLKGEKSVDVSDLPLLADFLKPPSEANADLDQAAVNAVAVAATLASIARDWLAENPDIAATVKDFLRRGALAVADDAAGVRHERVGLASTQLKFVAHGVMRLWLREGLDSEWEPLVLRLLTSGNAQVVAVIGWIAYHERERLGPVWWRLQQLGCLWSALSMLAPHYDSQEGRGPRWARWLARFRALKISGVAAGLDSLDLVKLAERLERLERDEQRRQVASGSRFVHRERKAHRLAGLQTDLFQGLFGWLVADGALPVGPDLDVARALLFKFFDYEAQWCADHADDNGEYHLPYSFGFQVVDRLAGLTAQDRDRGAEAWRAVLGLGPAAHSLIDHFLTAWSFETPASDVFAQRWREMIEFGLAQEWGEGAFWYDGEKLLRQLMGFNAISLLARRDDATAVVGGMADLYARWATRHLAVDERNIAAFANFLEAPFSQPLRMMGLARLVDMLDTPLGKRAWTRDSAGETVVALLDRMLAADLAAVRADPVARACILRLAAALAERKVPAALSLQERAAQLLR